MRYALEAALIVFSVLLALFLDGAAEARKEARIVNELVSHIADEMQSNLGIVDEWLPYHRAVIANIDRHLASDELLQSLRTPDGIDYGRLMEKGLIQDFYSNASWQLAQRNEATSRIDFEVTYAISKAYVSQQYVDATLVRLSDFFFQRQTQEPDELLTSLRILRSLMQELAGQESVLEASYREAVTVVGRGNGDSNAADADEE